MQQPAAACAIPFRPTIDANAYAAAKQAAAANYCLGRVIRSRRLFCRRVSVGIYGWPEWYGTGSRRLLHDKVLLSLYFGSRPRIKGKLGGKRLRYSLAAPHDRCKGNYRGKYWFV